MSVNFLGVQLGKQSLQGPFTPPGERTLKFCKTVCIDREMRLFIFKSRLPRQTGLFLSKCEKSMSYFLDGCPKNTKANTQGPTRSRVHSLGLLGNVTRLT